MHHRRIRGISIVVVGVTLAAPRVFGATDAAGTASTPIPAFSTEVVVVAVDEPPPATPCDIDPHFWKRLPPGPIDPGFSVTVSPDGAWGDVDPNFYVRIPCPLDVAPRRASEAATPAP